jgi:hypothetical protein
VCAEPWPSEREVPCTKGQRFERMVDLRLILHLRLTAGLAGWLVARRDGGRHLQPGCHMHHRCHHHSCQKVSVTLHAPSCQCLRKRTQHTHPLTHSHTNTSAVAYFELER